jgi:hypothetical protein
MLDPAERHGVQGAAAVAPAQRAGRDLPDPADAADVDLLAEATAANIARQRA